MSEARRRGLAVLALLAAGLSLGAALRSAQQQDWTYDEGDHLAYARRLLGTGETERRSQLQFNSKTPGTVPNVLALNRLSRFRFLEGPEPQRRKLAARLPTLLWFALLLAAVWAAAWRIAGPAAAHVALLVTALEPNLVANASIVTVDVLFTLTAVLGLGAAYALAERPGPARSLLLGLALGVAFVTKFAAFLLVPLVLLAALALRARRVGGGGRQSVGALARGGGGGRGARPGRGLRVGGSRGSVVEPRLARRAHANAGHAHAGDAIARADRLPHRRRHHHRAGAREGVAGARAGSPSARLVLLPSSGP